MKDVKIIGCPTCSTVCTTTATALRQSVRAYCQTCGKYVTIEITEKR